MTLNEAKMREALVKARLFVGCCDSELVLVNMGCIDRNKLCEEIDAALAAPPRNCDVGTAAEQEVRMARYCTEHHNKDKFVDICAKCPLYKQGIGQDCAFIWGQMPYEAQGSEAKKGGGE